MLALYKGVLVYTKTPYRVLVKHNDALNNKKINIYILGHDFRWSLCEIWFYQIGQHIEMIIILMYSLMYYLLMY